MDLPRILLVGPSSLVGYHLIKHYQPRSEVSVWDPSPKLTWRPVCTGRVPVHSAAVQGAPAGADVVIVLDETDSDFSQELATGLSAKPPRKLVVVRQLLRGERGSAKARPRASAAERWAKGLTKSSDVALVRLHEVYGKPVHETVRARSLLGRFASSVARQEPIAVPGKGRESRDFIHIEDAVRGIVAVADSEGASGTFEIGSGTATNLVEAADTVRRVMRFHAPILFEGSGSGEGRAADIRKATSLGWWPLVNLEDGVRDMCGSRALAA